MSKHRMQHLCDSLESSRDNLPAPRKSGVIPSLVLGFVLVGVGHPALHAQDIVVPNDLAENDGNTAFTTPDGTVNGLGYY